MTVEMNMTVIHRISHAPEPALHKRSILGAPMVVSDEMPPTRSMLDGKCYTSKAALRATYRPSGNEEGPCFVEVGNDPLGQGGRVGVDDHDGTE